MEKISVITPTVRKKGLSLIQDSLKHQSFTDYEWLIGSPFDPEIKEARWIKDDFEGGFWSLNRIYNKLFRRAKGELIVTWQDFIWTETKGLEKFWISYQETGAPISGVGNQYSALDEYGKPIQKVWDDPRITDEYGSFYECFPNDHEWNWACIPTKLIYEIGGADEVLDQLGFGGDQLQVCERLGDYGVKFYLDQANRSYTLKHGRVDDWEENHVLKNGEYKKRKETLKKSGKWPILDYLS